MVSFVLLSLLQLSSVMLGADLTLPWSIGINEEIRNHVNGDGLLVIKGHNPNTDSELVVIRMDDADSHDYYSRVNLERRIKPGAFELRISIEGLKKENKKPLNLATIRKLYVFNARKYSNRQQADRKEILIKSIALEKSHPLPSHIMAYDFGAEQSEVLEGTQSVSLNPISGITLSSEYPENLREIVRQGPEPWGKDGISGIDQLGMPLEKGLWRVVLFREDLGEWENLPRQLNLSVTINGIEQPSDSTKRFDTGDEKKSEKLGGNKASRWYQDEYLKFYYQEANKDPWEEIVRHRGLVQIFDFEQKDEYLTMRLLGDSPQQNFISGMILQKLDERIYRKKSNGLQLVNARREAYFRQHWLIEDQPLGEKDRSGSSAVQHKTLRLAQGEGRLVEFDIALKADTSLHWHSSFTQGGGYIEVRRAMPRWRRQGSAQYIKKRYSQLTAITTGLLKQGEYRIALWIKAGDKQSGNYAFSLVLNDLSNGPANDLVDKKNQILELSIEVLDQQLPINKQKVGVYLDHSPHLQYFEQWKSLQLAQVYCDLKYLKRLELQALAPPMSLPINEGEASWLKELALYQALYGNSDLLAYTPYKRLKERLNQNTLQETMAKITGLSRGVVINASQEASNIYWSIADEALIEQIPIIKEDAKQLHSANQIAKVAGHLNNPNQNSLIPHLDLVLINHGFGVDKAEIKKIHRMKTANSPENKRVWLYNMPDFRLAAGAFLWHSKADAYVQWHARMPTANPYDPTDGREADYQFFYPQPIACMAIPDVDKALFELAMGQYELRWFLWLERRVEQGNSPGAKALKEKIERALGGNWRQAQRVNHSQLEQWREQIIELAQLLIEPD